ncbi:hypothetical protein, partial [Bradyrhizobium sp. NAS96.2]|uniref:hypothetical protein n=1 Tax=Bradyrhizobium sp. NAS96.2 TaxID=1680160 RepID=UPI00143D21F1
PPMPKEEFKSSAATNASSTSGITLGELVEQYKTHTDSGYQKLKFAVRKNYDNLLGHIVKTLGHVRLRDFDADTIWEAYKGWVDGEKLALGHSMIGKLRLLCTFGITVLKDEDAIRLSTILNKIKTPASEGKRTEQLTKEHVLKIRELAHEAGWHSIAIVQAFQHDFADKFRQADLIGEWVPLSEPGESNIRNEQGEKWLRGIKWNQIDDRLILRHMITSGRANEQKMIEVDLKRGAMVLEEINRIPQHHRVGPIALNEFNGLPWKGTQFRRRWRTVANRAGVPKEIKNFDSGRELPSDEVANSRAELAL